MEKKKSVVIGGKEIPLTKNGLPNQVYLSKDSRAMVKSFNEKLKGKEKAATEKELSDLFKTLGL
jgi:hypothetical protein